MSVLELVHRFAERWRHRSDASFAGAVANIQLGEAADGVIDLPTCKMAPEALKTALARDAVALMQGDWKLFGWRGVNVGAMPQWHSDATCGVEIPMNVLSHRLNHRALSNGADVRTVWEINRWSEMVRLAMHAWVNSDLQAAGVAIEWMSDWCDKNLVGYGVNWTSPLEAGLRLMNFAWFDVLVDGLARRAGHLGHEDGEILNALKRAQRALSGRVVPAHAAWVWRYRSFGSSANNHLLGELVGLLHAVKRWPTLEAVICPAQTLWNEISRCVLEQFAEDGGNKEQALHYHLFAWEMGWHAARLMRTQDGLVLERLRKAAEFFIHVAHAGEQWEYGDTDDAQIVPVTLNRDNAVSEWKEWMSGRSDGSIGYWLGEFPQVASGNERRQQTQTAKASGTWWLAPQSGVAVSEGHRWKLRLDASALGYGKLAAHGHADALHLSIWDGAEALVIDPGTGGYFGAKEIRTELAGWKAHNGPQPICGFRTPNRGGTFLWIGSHQTPVVCHRGSQISATLRHEGKELERSVHINDHRVIVTDKLADGGRLSARWHFAPECTVSINDSESGVVHIKRGPHRWTVQYSSDTDTCELALAEGIASRAYGRTEPCTVLVVAAVGTIHAHWSRTAVADVDLISQRDAVRGAPLIHRPAIHS